MTTSVYDIRCIREEAKVRWLTPLEVLIIMLKCDENQIMYKTPLHPPSGALLLFNRKFATFFYKDGYSWTRKKDKNALGEEHERLKVGNVEVLDCYYAHGEPNLFFQRHCYSMLNQEMEHIVLVHYRYTDIDKYDVSRSRYTTGPLSTSSPGSSSTLVQCCNSYASHFSTFNQTDVSSWERATNSEVHQSFTSQLNDNEKASYLLRMEREDLKRSSNTRTRNVYGSDSYYPKTVDQEPKFTIREISPEWGYANESTKIFIIGTFTCDSAKDEWSCMFGDIKVPVEIIQEGVIRCQTPPCSPGKVTLSITSNNHQSHSDIREFEYRNKSSSYTHENAESLDELLTLINLVQTLQSDHVAQRGESVITQDSWNQLIDGLSDKSLTTCNAIYWILEQLVKDKLQQWLSSRLKDKGALSKREQRMIHIVSVLGFCWALAPILDSGVSINFVDNNGWTALHWAACFGREEMVAELLDFGAFTGAIIDPSVKTPASIAFENGHFALGYYLSESALTDHRNKYANQDDHHATLSIKKEVIAFHQKAVKIQACVRGRQVRKSYKVIKGMILELVSADERDDVVKAFRKKKVNVAIGDAVSKVLLSMVDSQQACQPNRYILENHGGFGGEVASNSMKKDGGFWWEE